MTMTFTDVLARHNVTLPDSILADLEVPVLTGPQRQGDVGIFPRPTLGGAELAGMTPIPADGIPVVRGEATGNTHILDALTGVCLWRAHTASIDGDVVLGILHVPDGGVAMLIHTDEHSANGIGPGTYTLRGKREQAEEIRRVAD